MKNKVLVAMGIGISAAMAPAVAAVADEVDINTAESYDETADGEDHNDDGDTLDKMEVHRDEAALAEVDNSTIQVGSEGLEDPVKVAEVTITDVSEPEVYDSGIEYEAASKEEAAILASQEMLDAEKAGYKDVKISEIEGSGFTKDWEPDDGKGQYVAKSEEEAEQLAAAEIEQAKKEGYTYSGVTKVGDKYTVTIDGQEQDITDIAFAGIENYTFNIVEENGAKVVSYVDENGEKQAITGDLAEALIKSGVYKLEGTDFVVEDTNEYKVEKKVSEEGKESVTIKDKNGKDIDPDDELGKEILKQTEDESKVSFALSDGTEVGDTQHSYTVEKSVDEDGEASYTLTDKTAKGSSEYKVKINSDGKLTVKDSSDQDVNDTKIIGKVIELTGIRDKEITYTLTDGTKVGTTQHTYTVARNVAGSGAESYTVTDTTSAGAFVYKVKIEADGTLTVTDDEDNAVTDTAIIGKVIDVTNIRNKDITYTLSDFTEVGTTQHTYTVEKSVAGNGSASYTVTDKTKDGSSVYNVQIAADNTLTVTDADGNAVNDTKIIGNVIKLTGIRDKEVTYTLSDNKTEVGTTQHTYTVKKSVDGNGTASYKVTDKTKDGSSVYDVQIAADDTLTVTDADGNAVNDTTIISKVIELTGIRNNDILYTLSDGKTIVGIAQHTYTVTKSVDGDGAASYKITDKTADGSAVYNVQIAADNTLTVTDAAGKAVTDTTVIGKVIDLTGIRNKEITYTLSDADKTAVGTTQHTYTVTKNVAGNGTANYKVTDTTKAGSTVYNVQIAADNTLTVTDAKGETVSDTTIIGKVIELTGIQNKEITYTLSDLTTEVGKVQHTYTVEKSVAGNGAASYKVTDKTDDGSAVYNVQIAADNTLTVTDAAGEAVKDTTIIGKVIELTGIQNKEITYTLSDNKTAVGTTQHTYTVTKSVDGDGAASYKVTDKADDGSAVYNVQIAADNTLTVTDESGKAVNDTTIIGKVIELTGIQNKEITYTLSDKDSTAVGTTQHTYTVEKSVDGNGTATYTLTDESVDGSFTYNVQIAADGKLTVKDAAGNAVTDTTVIGKVIELTNIQNKEITYTLSDKDSTAVGTTQHTYTVTKSVNKDGVTSYSLTDRTADGTAEYKVQIAANGTLTVTDAKGEAVNDTTIIGKVIELTGIQNKEITYTLSDKDNTAVGITQHTYTVKKDVAADRSVKYTITDTTGAGFTVYNVQIDAEGNLTVTDALLGTAVNDISILSKVVELTNIKDANVTFTLDDLTEIGTTQHTYKVVDGVVTDETGTEVTDQKIKEAVLTVSGKNVSYTLIDGTTEKSISKADYDLLNGLEVIYDYKTGEYTYTRNGEATTLTQTQENNDYVKALKAAAKTDAKEGNWSAWTTTKPKYYTMRKTFNLVEERDYNLDSGLNAEITVDGKDLNLNFIGIITQKMDLYGNIASNFLVYGDVKANGYKVGAMDGEKHDEHGVSKTSYYTGEISKGITYNRPGQSWFNPGDKAEKLNVDDNEAGFKEAVDAIQAVADAYENKVRLTAKDLSQLDSNHKIKTDPETYTAHVIVDCSNAANEISLGGYYVTNNKYANGLDWDGVRAQQKAIDPQYVIFDFGDYDGTIKLDGFAGVCIAKNAKVNVVGTCEGQVVCKEFTNSAAWYAVSCNVNITHEYRVKEKVGYAQADIFKTVGSTGLLEVTAYTTGSTSETALTSGKTDATAKTSGNVSATEYTSGKTDATALTSGNITATAKTNGSASATEYTSGNTSATALTSGSTSAEATTSGGITGKAFTTGSTSAEAFTTGFGSGSIRSVGTANVEQAGVYEISASKEMSLYEVTGSRQTQTVSTYEYFGNRTTTTTTPPPPPENPPTPPTTPPTPPTEGTVLGAQRSGSVLGKRRSPEVLGKRRSPKTADAAMGGMVAGMMLSTMTAFGGAAVLKKKREDEE